MIVGVVLAAVLAAPVNAAGPLRPPSEATVTKPSAVLANGAQTFQGCVQMKRALSAGATPVHRDLEPTDCPATAPQRAFRYDPGSGFARATRDLAAGDVLTSVPSALVADVAQGEVLYLQSRVGAVDVERAVTAVRPGRVGRPLLVRGADGQVFQAPKLERLQ